MTWKEFKEKVEAEGITNNTNMDYIDWYGGELQIRTYKDNQYHEDYVIIEQ